MATETQRTPYDQEIKARQPGTPFYVGDNEIRLLQAKREGYLEAMKAHADLLAALEGLLAEGPKRVRDLGSLVDPVTYSAAIQRASIAVRQAKEV